MLSIFKEDSPYSIQIEAVEDIFQTGKVINGFLVGEEVYRGGMAVLYSATREDIDQPILLKIPRVGKDQPVESLIAFETELTIFKALKSPYVPNFYAAGNMAKNPFIAMQRVQGESLEKILQREGQLPVERTLLIAENITKALQSLHLEEVIHLDLKPDNILIQENNEVVLIDFGLAHHARFPDLLAEQMRKGIGSAPYIAPEQIVGVRNDLRSDLYSLGVILYEMLTGELPFDNPRSLSGLKKRFWAQPIPPRSIRKDIPNWLQEIILRSMEPFAKDRYQSATQVRQLLRNPDAVGLTDRAYQTKPIGFWQNSKRWFKAAGYEPSPIIKSSIAYELTPLIIVALDMRNLSEELRSKMQRSLRNLLQIYTEARVSCVSVLANTPTFEGDKEIESASGLVRGILVQMMDWMAPLKLTSEKTSFHVLESFDPASRIIEFAQDNDAAIIMVGQAAKSAASNLRPWRSNMTKIVEEAKCTVLVVKISRGDS